MNKLLSTKEVAAYLQVNEKMIYALISDKGLPATKITGKWMFPLHLVEQWIDSQTLNSPTRGGRDLSQNLLVFAGSNDPLLMRTLSLFAEKNPGHLASYSDLGSRGGISALRQGLCHAACSHLVQDENHDYNFLAAARELEFSPAVVNFCRREQGLLVAKGNPHRLRDIAGIARLGLTIANRPQGTGTRTLLDTALREADVSPDSVSGYQQEMQSHFEVGVEVLSGRAQTGLAIRAVAHLLGLDFIPLQWERFDLLIPKERFFERSLQVFLSLLTSSRFKELAESLPGYDISSSGQMMYPE